MQVKSNAVYGADAGTFPIHPSRGPGKDYKLTVHAEHIPGESIICRCEDFPKYALLLLRLTDSRKRRFKGLPSRLYKGSVITARLNNEEVNKYPAHRDMVATFDPVLPAEIRGSASIVYNGVV